MTRSVLAAALLAVVAVCSGGAARAAVVVGVGGEVAPPAKSPKKPAARPAAKPGVTGEAARKDAERLIDEFTSKPTASSSEQVAIGKLIGDLSSDSYQVREAASEKIAKYGLKALPQLEKATKSSDPEVSNRAELSVARLKDGSREYRILTGLRRVRKEALGVIDARIKKRQELSAAAKKLATDLQAKGKKDESLAELKRAKGAVEQATVLAELRKKVAVDDPLDEVKALMRKGKRNEAIRKLQAELRKLQQAGKLSPALQAKYQKVLMDIYRGVKF